MAEITCSQLRAFLTRAGWERVGEDGAGESWVKPGANGLPAILIPTTQHAEDHAALLSMAVERLRWVTGLSNDDLVRQMPSIGPDD
jgi:hypothetical protein